MGTACTSATQRGFSLQTSDWTRRGEASLLHCLKARLKNQKLYKALKLQVTGSIDPDGGLTALKPRRVSRALPSGERSWARHSGRGRGAPLSARVRGSVGVRGEVRAGTAASRLQVDLGKLCPPGWLDPVTEPILSLFTCGPGALGHACLVENRHRVTGPRAKGRLKKAAPPESGQGGRGGGAATRVGPSGRGPGLKSGMAHAAADHAGTSCGPVRAPTLPRWMPADRLALLGAGGRSRGCPARAGHAAENSVGSGETTRRGARPSAGSRKYISNLQDQISDEVSHVGL